ncbi:ABC transporter permease [Lysinibacillus xylanilyticus]|uniref:ABC transporter permease n=1 Tax=Lysinibacillus xylanilyticus TaxID=582475 RepID=UPI0037FA3373
MSETTATALKFAAGIVLAIVLIGIAVMVFKPAGDSAKSVSKDFEAINTELQDQKYLQYEDTAVSGSQVLSALRRFEQQAKEEQIALSVQTGKNTTDQWYHAKFESDKITKTGASGISKTTDVTDPEYINPSGMFTASVHRDSNGVIRAIKFVQKKQ